MCARLASPVPSAGYGVAWRLTQSNCFTLATLFKLEHASHCAHLKAFGVSDVDVSRLIRDPSVSLREAFEARPAPPKKRERPTKGKAGGGRRKKTKCIEGARQKANGKWSDTRMFPGREFDDLDAFRAAKKQHAARRAAWSVQARDFGGSR